MDRITVPVEGELLVLTVDGVEHGMEKFRPFRYSGDSPAEAALPTGPVTVLNTFVDRNTTGASVMVAELSKKNPQTLGDGQFLVLLHGIATVTAADGSTAALEPLDTVAGADRTSGSAGTRLCRRRLLLRSGLAEAPGDKQKRRLPPEGKQAPLAL